MFRKTIFNDGMVGYWNLDESGGTTINDNSGFTNTGTSTAMTWSTTSGPPLAFANVSYGTFNGSSSRIALTTSQLPATNATQSIAAWVNINAMPGSGSWKSIVSLLGSSGAVVLGLTSTGVSVERNDGTLLVPATALSTGTWHHVAYTWNGTNTNTLYVDGVAVATSATAHDNAAVTAAFIGATVPTAEFFNGSIDEVRIYDRALTGLEVSSLALGRTPQTSIATHTFSDAFTACDRDQHRRPGHRVGDRHGDEHDHRRGELAELRRAVHRQRHRHADEQRGGRLAVGRFEPSRR